MKKLFGMIVFFAQGLMLSATSVSTSGDSGMPWESPLSKIQNALSGNTLRIISLILIILGGIVIAVSEGSGIKKKGAWIIIGIAIAANASSLVSTLFGISGALL